MSLLKDTVTEYPGSAGSAANPDEGGRPEEEG